MTMKQLKLWMFTTILICGGALLVTSCSNDDNSVITISNHKVSINGLKYYLYPETHEAVIDNGNTWAGELNIPSEIKYKGMTFVVNGMASNAFLNSSELTKIRIPKTIERVIHHILTDDDSTGGTIAPTFMNPFVGCTALESIEVDNDNPIFSSVGGVLFSKDGTALYAYPAGIKAEKYTVPESVSWIGACAFKGNDNIVSVELPETVTKIHGAAFYDCRNLEYVNLPKNLTYLSEWLFRNCSRLKWIDIPSGVKSIEERVFWGCSSLKAIELPESVTYIGDYVFYDCMLDELIIRGCIDDQCFNNYPFVGLNESAKVYVPASEVDKYKEFFKGSVFPLVEMPTED